jgi:uncharacterized protein
MNPARRASWGPYAVGAGIGLLETVAMATAKRPLGITSVFEQGAARVNRAIDPASARRYHEAGGEEPKVGWETALVAGVLAGSALSASLSGDRRPRRVPALWRQHVGPSRAGRYLASVAGGALMMFGARMAKGCTSGHGISGSMQFAASSWAFNPIMFASGAAVARALFGRSR